MLVSLEGLDHCVFVVRDLDIAAQGWHDLGFTVSPRAEHSAHMGTGNHTIMFDDDYIELLGNLTKTELNEHSRAFLERRGEGVYLAAFRMTDAEADITARAEKNIEAEGPIRFSRPVKLPGGATTEASFSIFRLPPDERPADVGIFACQHHTRESVWVPGLMDHANTAFGLNRLDIITYDPDDAAREMAAVVEGVSRSVAAGVQVEAGYQRASFMFMTKQSFTENYGITDDSVLPDEGVGALVVRVHDLDEAARCVGHSAIKVGPNAVAAYANGVLIVFQSV